MASVSVLQSASNHREKHTGTHVRLPLGQDTDERLDGKCGVLPVGFVCGKYRSLVQTPVFARGLSLPEGISSGIQNNRRVTVTRKFSNLQKTREVSLYERPEKISVFTHF